MKNYGYASFINKWDEILTQTHEQCGSWENRKSYKGWELSEI